MCTNVTFRKCELLAFTSASRDSILPGVKSTDSQPSFQPLADLRRGDVALVTGLADLGSVPLAGHDPALLTRLRAAAGKLDIDLAEGVYLATAGPTFETPAEIRMFRTLGADAVGMSTVPEVILARHAGLRVAAVSAITNLAEGMGGEELSHEQTLRNAEIAARDLVRLVQTFAEDYEA
jgi:hypothetical protein